jgi:hypothetical protein
VREEGKTTSGDGELETQRNRGTEEGNFHSPKKTAYIF